MKKSQIENARRQMMEQPNAATNCSAWRVKPQEVADMLKRYGSGESFLNTFNPDLQVMTARYTERAYFGTAPSLATVAEGYGEQLAIVWNCIQLENINLFAGVKEKMNVERQKELSRLILAEYPQLKVTELLLFFHRLKCGRYGRFYGTVDALFIASALLSFMDERRAETSLYKAAAKKKEIAPEKKSGNGITYQEYLLLKSEKQQNKKI
nr:DUF6633 family protein [Parabacteroides goldsteinii]